MILAVCCVHHWRLLEFEASLTEFIDALEDNTRLAPASRNLQLPLPLYNVHGFGDK